MWRPCSRTRDERPSWSPPTRLTRRRLRVGHPSPSRRLPPSNRRGRPPNACISGPRRGPRRCSRRPSRRPPGLTPEQRHALAAFLGQGGVVLLALGPRAAAAPLGASFEDVLRGAVAWREARSKGADPARVTGLLASDAQSLTDLGAPRRAELSSDDIAGLDVLAAWTDGAPLIARRPVGRGEAWIVTLPFAVDASDLPVRPAFLALLDGWVRAARRHGVDRRVSVGSAWTFPGNRQGERLGSAGRTPRIAERRALAFRACGHRSL